MAGKSFQDRELASKVRSKALNDLLLVLSDDPKVENWSQYRKDLLKSLSHTILPRLQEVTGEDGGAIKIEGVEITVRR